MGLKPLLQSQVILIRPSPALRHKPVFSLWLSAQVHVEFQAPLTSPTASIFLGPACRKTWHVDHLTLTLTFDRRAPQSNFGSVATKNIVHTTIHFLPVPPLLLLFNVEPGLCLFQVCSLSAVRSQIWTILCDQILAKLRCLHNFILLTLLHPPALLPMASAYWNTFHRPKSPSVISLCFYLIAASITVICFAIVDVYSFFASLLTQLVKLTVI